MTRPATDIAASVRARLLRHATARGEDFELVLTRYANERLLHRLTKSAHAGQFVLKGATLFTIWTGEPHRATRDVDLLGFGDPSVGAVRAMFERRRTPLPLDPTAGLTSAFYDDHGKQQQWRAFLRKTGARDIADLADAVAVVSGFLARPLEVAARGQPWTAQWPAGGPWREMRLDQP